MSNDDWRNVSDPRLAEELRNTAHALSPGGMANLMKGDCIDLASAFNEAARRLEIRQAIVGSRQVAMTAELDERIRGAVDANRLAKELAEAHAQLANLHKVVAERGDKLNADAHRIANLEAERERAISELRRALAARDEARAEAELQKTAHLDTSKSAEFAYYERDRAINALEAANAINAELTKKAIAAEATATNLSEANARVIEERNRAQANERRLRAAIEDHAKGWVGLTAALEG